MQTLVWVISIILFIFIGYLFIDNNILWLTHKKVSTSNLPPDFVGIKIIQLSDLHDKSFGKNNKRLINTVKKENPDFIMLTGDIISRHTTDFSKAEDLFHSLAQIAPIYACLGNHEADLPTELKESFINIMRSNKIHTLINQSITIIKNKSSINIAGISIDHACYKNPNGSYKALKGYSVSDLKNALGSHYNYTILLAHNPIFFPTYSDWGAELTLSGHVHGGIIRIPFLCGFLSPERRFFPKYTSGIYRINSSIMMLSRGLGKLRLFNPPQIIVITLQ